MIALVAVPALMFLFEWYGRWIDRRYVETMGKQLDELRSKLNGRTYADLSPGEKRVLIAHWK